jgi:hypothetical protein
MPLFDHLVGPNEQRRWHSEAKSLRRSEVDDQFNVGRKLDRQVGGLRAFEYPVDVIRRPVSTPLEVGTVTDQASRVDVLAIAVDRGQPLRRRGFGNRLPCKEQHVALLDDHRLDAGRGQGLVRRVNIGGGAHLRGHDLDF